MAEIGVVNLCGATDGHNMITVAVIYVTTAGSADTCVKDI